MASALSCRRLSSSISRTRSWRCGVVDHADNWVWRDHLGPTGTGLGVFDTNATHAMSPEQMSFGPTAIRTTTTPFQRGRATGSSST